MTSSCSSMASGSTDDSMSFDELKTLLECPVCMEMSSPPIYNCQVGHIICYNCQRRVKKCPVCREEFKGCRNFIAEKLAEKCLRKCKYQEDGCNTRVKVSALQQHEAACEYRPMKCHIGSCGQMVPFMKYFDHLGKFHRIFAAADNTHFWEREMFVYDIKRLVKDGARNPFAMTCYNNNFLQFMQVDDQTVWIWVALCGLEKDAEGFKAKIVIANKAKNLEIQWTGPVHSARKTGSEVYTTGLCLITTGNGLKNYMEQVGRKYVWSMTINISQISDSESKVDTDSDDYYDSDVDELEPYNFPVREDSDEDDDFE